MVNAFHVNAARAALFFLEGKWVQVAALLSLSAFLAGCAALSGPEAAATLGTVAAGAAAIDWLLANDVLPPELAENLASWFTQTNEAIALANQGLNEVRENSVTVEQATYGASGTVAGVLALIRAWRGGASKGPLKAVVDGLKTVAGNVATPKPKVPPAE